MVVTNRVVDEEEEEDHVDAGLLPQGGQHLNQSTTWINVAIISSKMHPTSAF
jgi:hypothetical protein